MRLVTYDRGGARRLAAWVGDVVVDLPDAVGHPAFPATLEALVARGGGTTMDAAAAALEQPGAAEAFAVPRARLLPPLALDDERGAIVLGSGGVVQWRGEVGTDLVCRPELVCVVGRGGARLTEDLAARSIFGYTLVIGWAGRNGGGGEPVPIATSVGPCLVTPDQFDPGGKPFTVEVDGRTVAEVSLHRAIARRFARTIARASRKGPIEPGEIYGVGPIRLPIPVATSRRRGPRTQEVAVALEVAGVGRLEGRVRTARRALARR